MSSPALPQLAAPGAGLPWPERWIARYWVMGFIAPQKSWYECIEQFERSTQHLLNAAQEIQKMGGMSLLEQKVLIPRIAGIEDSSRNWSVAEVMEHLIITAPQMAYVIETLSRGLTPDGKVDIAAVKPKGAMKAADTAHLFAEQMTQVSKRLHSIPADLWPGRHRFEHPWFGPLTAKQWVWLVGFHQAIHAKQVRRIQQKLG